MKRILSIAAIGFALLVPAAAQAVPVPLLHIYGINPDAPSDIYLGCINCSKNDRLSIGNSMSYGSTISQASVFNSIGTYGSTISDYSACNPIAKYPPQIRTIKGEIVGVLTVNRSLVDEYYRLDPRLLNAC
jgi:hypothetical protein